MALEIPQVFDVNVNQNQPFAVEIRAGQKVVLLALAAMATLIVWKKIR